MTTDRPSIRSGRAQARAELIADTAIRLLVERGTRGLTHRAVDEAAGLPAGSTSNHARTRATLLESAVRRLAVRESAVLTPERPPGPPPALAHLVPDIARGLRRYLTEHRELLVARYELALEATRRPALRECYDQIGARTFLEPLTALLRDAGSAEPDRHARSLVAWCEGVLFASTVGSHNATPPSHEELLRGVSELLHGMLPEYGRGTPG